MSQSVVYTNRVGECLDAIVSDLAPSRLFVLVDDNTGCCVLPRLAEECRLINEAHIISIAPGDENKTLETLTHVWYELSANGATRSSLLINVGGGMVTDLGAFAASTFKRGMPFVNIPTTLLAAVDASVGGKTGINFNNLKNEIGVFSEARTVIISTQYFDTLPAEELRSGYAEVVKHSLLDTAVSFDALIRQNVCDIGHDTLLDIVRRSVGVKEKIVAQDPHENGLRCSLNLGHTAGHAFETLALTRHNPIPHGCAVAHGLIVTLILSHMKLGLDTSLLYKLSSWVSMNYDFFRFTCDDYPDLVELMAHDKKNRQAGEISFTLLRSIGAAECGVVVSHADIKTAFDIYRDIMKI